ncbi:hypothetical protein SCHPADRAFT_927376 [Schizopora paradoxa]|uniref:Uncharacterized protein n=1 Tax=Schizopora paradoxa TaxID=27342 RepID=A0A0H2RSV7_9AGAM|nr:hypothetical protein SCHPADRAFT_927376 [Schizopora paradoxa]
MSLSSIEKRTCKQAKLVMKLSEAGRKILPDRNQHEKTFSKREKDDAERVRTRKPSDMTPEPDDHEERRGGRGARLTGRKYLWVEDYALQNEMEIEGHLGFGRAQSDHDSLAMCMAPISESRLQLIHEETHNHAINHASPTNDDGNSTTALYFGSFKSLTSLSVETRHVGLLHRDPQALIRPDS